VLSTQQSLVGSSQDFIREQDRSWAWKWSTSDVDCSSLITVTRANSVTLTIQQQRRSISASRQWPSQQQQYRPRPYNRVIRRLASVDVPTAAVLKASAMMALYGADHPRSCGVDT